jgi:hypothetical protein
MTLDKSPEIGCFDFPDISLIDLTARYSSRGYQFSEPFRLEPVMLVVVRTHSSPRVAARPAGINDARLITGLGLFPPLAAGRNLRYRTGQGGLPFVAAGVLSGFQNFRPKLPAAPDPFLSVSAQT